MCFLSWGTKRAAPFLPDVHILILEPLLVIVPGKGDFADRVEPRTVERGSSWIIQVAQCPHEGPQRTEEGAGGSEKEVTGRDSVGSDCRDVPPVRVSVVLSVLHTSPDRVPTEPPWGQEGTCPVCPAPRVFADPEITLVGSEQQL